MIDNSDTNILLYLLRLALGNESSSEPNWTINWRNVMSLAERQGVLGLAFDGLQKTSIPHCLDIELYLEWLGKVECMEDLYAEYCKAVEELFLFLNGRDFDVFLLKGLGCAMNYPIPSHRPCGDIDIWSQGDEIGINEALAQRLGVPIPKKSRHHSSFSFNGFLVENHRTILDEYSHKSSVVLNEILEQCSHDHCEVPVLNAKVMVPSSRFYSIHLLRHMASDFATISTSLKQVLDWANFVMANSKGIETNRIDWKFIFDVSRDTHMVQFLNAINNICVKYLGFDVEYFPVSEVNDDLCDRVIMDILLDNNDKSMALPQGVVEVTRYGFKKTRRMIGNRWKYRMVYDESLFESFVCLSKNRISSLLLVK